MSAGSAHQIDHRLAAAAAAVVVVAEPAHRTDHQTVVVVAVAVGFDQQRVLPFAGLCWMPLPQRDHHFVVVGQCRKD